MENQESSSNRISLISKFVRDALKRRLSKFLENPNIETQGSLTRPEVTMKKLTLREDAFNMIVLPVSVTRQSMVDSLHAQFPLTSFKTKPVVLTLSNIRIFAVPNEVNWTDVGLNKEKTKKLDEWKEERKSEFRDMEKKGWLKNIKQKILNNIKQTIRNMEIVYLDNKSMGYPCFVRIYIGRLEMETTNSSWQPEFSNDQSATYRLINISEFSIALVAEKFETDGDIQDMHDYYRRISLSERHYILKPCKITIKHKLSHTDPLEEPWNTARVEIAGLEVSLNEVQFQYIKHLLNYINFKQSYKRYQTARPQVAVTDDPRAWWNYLVSAAKQDIQANFKALYENKERMERYIDLFKRHQDIIHSPWLQHLKQPEVEELSRLEVMLPVNDILFYRSVALNHLRIEAMQYVRAKGNVKGITHLGDLWDYYLNDFESLLGDPNQQVAREEEVEMNREEKQELKILMSMDKQQALKSLLSGKSSTAHDQTFKIDFHVKHLIFYLQKSGEDNIESQEFYDRKACTCSICALRPKDRTVRAGKFESNRLGFLRTAKRVAFPDYHSEREEDEEERKIASNSLLRQGYSEADGDRSVDYVVEIEKITHDDPDPKLLGEYTLFVLNLERISGKIGLLRNGRLWTEEDSSIAIEKIKMWDPISLRDAGVRQSFFDAYKLKNLLDDLIELNVNDDPAFYSLRHFMRLSGALNVFEFYVHYKEVAPAADSKGLIVGKTTHRYCNCGRSYTLDALLGIAFHDETASGLIHMSALERPSNVDEMGKVATRVREHFTENVLPYFVRRCARWIFPSCLRRVAPEDAKTANRRTGLGAHREIPRSKAQLVAEFEFLGEKNPIEVTFGQGPQRVVQSKEKKRSDLSIQLNAPSMVLSNTTISALMQWIVFEESETEVFAKESLRATFRERLRRMRPELFMVSEFHRQAQKDVRHLYNYMKDLVQTSRELRTKVKISSLCISLLDEKSLSKYRSPPILVAELADIELVAECRPDSDDSEPVSPSRPRHGMAKDLKFYKQISLQVNAVAVKSMGKQLLSTSLKVHVCQCLVQHHPELPDLVVDAHIPELRLSVSTAMLPLLSFLDNLDSRTVRQAEEAGERRSEVSLGFESLFRVDLKKTKSLLKKLNKEHYKHKSPCGHCQILYTKQRNLVYFSIGSVRSVQGLEISMMPDDALTPSLSLKVPVVVFSFHEKCFLKTASLLMAEATLEGTLDEKIAITVHNSKRCSFPVIPAKVFEQLPNLRSALNIKAQYEENECEQYHSAVMQEVMVMRQHVHPEVYTEKEWDYREGEYLRNKQQKKGLVKPARGFDRRPVNLRESDIRYSDADYLFVNIAEVAIRLEKPLQESRLLASVLGVSSLFSAAKKLTPVPLPVAAGKKKGKLTVIAQVARLAFVCKHQEAELSVSVQDLAFKQTPHRSHDMPAIDSKKNIETVMVEANRLEVTLKAGSEAEFEAERVIRGSMDKFSGVFELIREHSQYYHKGVFRMSSFYIADVTDSPEGVLLLAVPSSIRGETIQRPSGNSVTVNYDDKPGSSKVAVEVDPVAVMLRAETIVELKQFFERIARFTHFQSPLEPEGILIEGELVDSLGEQITPMSVRVKSLQGVLGVRQEFFLTVELKDFWVRHEEEFVFEGEVGDLGLTTKLKEYPNAVTKGDEAPIFTFELNTRDNSLSLSNHGLHIRFINRLVEEIVGYLKMVNPPKARDEDEPLSIDFVFSDATMYLPNSSEKRDMVVFQFETLRVTNGTEEVRVTVPLQIESPKQIFKKFEYDVALGEKTETHNCESMLLHGVRAECFVRCNGRDQYFGAIPDTLVSILSPPSAPLEKEWKLETQIDVKMREPLLVPSLSDFVHFVDIIEANIDEKSPLFEKLARSENTQFDIRIETGTVVIDKWVNAPVEEESVPEDTPAIPHLSELRLMSTPILPIAEIESEPQSDHEDIKVTDELQDDVSNLLTALI